MSIFHHRFDQYKKDFWKENRCVFINTQSEGGLEENEEENNKNAQGEKSNVADETNEILGKNIQKTRANIDISLKSGTIDLGEVVNTNMNPEDLSPSLLETPSSSQNIQSEQESFELFSPVSFEISKRIAEILHDPTLVGQSKIRQETLNKVRYALTHEEQIELERYQRAQDVFRYGEKIDKPLELPAGIAFNEKTDQYEYQKARVVDSYRKSPRYEYRDILNQSPDLKGQLNSLLRKCSKIEDTKITKKTVAVIDSQGGNFPDREHLKIDYTEKDEKMVQDLFEDMRKKVKVHAAMKLKPKFFTKEISKIIANNPKLSEEAVKLLHNKLQYRFNAKFIEKNIKELEKKIKNLQSLEKSLRRRKVSQLSRDANKNTLLREAQSFCSKSKSVEKNVKNLSPQDIQRYYKHLEVYQEKLEKHKTQKVKEFQNIEENKGPFAKDIHKFQRSLFIPYLAQHYKKIDTKLIQSMIHFKDEPGIKKLESLLEKYGSQPNILQKHWEQYLKNNHLPNRLGYLERLGIRPEMITKMRKMSDVQGALWWFYKLQSQITPGYVNSKHQEEDVQVKLKNGEISEDEAQKQIAEIQKKQKNAEQKGVESINTQLRAITSHDVQYDRAMIEALTKDIQTKQSPVLLLKGFQQLSAVGVARLCETRDTFSKYQTSSTPSNSMVVVHEGMLIINMAHPDVQKLTVQKANAPVAHDIQDAFGKVSNAFLEAVEVWKQKNPPLQDINDLQKLLFEKREGKEVLSKISELKTLGTVVEYKSSEEFYNSIDEDFHAKGHVIAFNNKIHIHPDYSAYKNVLDTFEGRKVADSNFEKDLKNVRKNLFTGLQDYVEGCSNGTPEDRKMRCNMGFEGYFYGVMRNLRSDLRNGTVETFMQNMQNLEDIGVVTYVSNEEFQKKYGHVTDQYMVASSFNKIYINKEDPRYEEIQNILRSSNKQSVLSSNTAIAEFVGAIDEEARHVQQFVNPHIIEHFGEKLDSHPEGQELYRKAESLFGNKYQHVHGEKKRKLILAELEAAMQKRSLFTNSPRAQQGKYLQLAKDVENFMNTNKTSSKLKVSKPEEIFAGATSTEEQSSFGGGTSKKDKPDDSHLKKFDREELGKIRIKFKNLADQFPILLRKAELVGDDDFLKDAQEIYSGIEEMMGDLQNIASEKDIDTPENQNKIRFINKYMEKLEAEIGSNDPDPKNKSGAYKTIHAYGEMPGTGFIKRLWKQTTFLRISDIAKAWEIGYNWMDRRYTVAQDKRVGNTINDTFKDIPGMKTLAQDGLNQAQSKESEEVSTHQDALKNSELHEVIYTLHNPAGNQERMKAAFQELAARGNLEPQWSNKLVWKRITEFCAGLTDYDFRVTSRNSLEQGIDLIWGQGTAEGFYKDDGAAFNQVMDEQTPKVQGANPAPLYKEWIEKLKKFKKSKDEGDTDWSLINKCHEGILAGYIKGDLEYGGSHGADILSFAQEVICLGGITDKALGNFKVGLMGKTPTYCLQSAGDAKKYGLSEWPNWSPEMAGQDSPMVQFMRGERALMLNYNPETLQHDPLKQHLCTVYDFQKQRTKVNNDSSNNTSWDKEHMSELWASVDRREIEIFATPSSMGGPNAEPMQKASTISAGVEGLLKYTINVAKEHGVNDKEQLLYRKRTMKRELRKMLLAIEFFKRSNEARKAKDEDGNIFTRYDMKGENFFAQNPDDPNYEDHVPEVKVEEACSKFKSARGQSRWNDACYGYRELGKLGAELQFEMEKSGGPIVDGAGKKISIKNDIIENITYESPLEYYATLMRAVDRMGTKV